MGKRGQRRSTKKPDTDDLMEALFSPIPKAKRDELNQLAESLLTLTSNFIDEPTTPSKLYDEYEKIHALVTRICELEECNMSRKVTGSRAAYIKPFLEWLAANGAVIDGVKIADFGDQGFGLKVTKSIQKGDVVLSIPTNLCMTTETARDSSLGPLMEKDPMLRQMPNVALALHLVLEKTSPASFWEPYINILPRSYNTVLFYTPENFKELRGSPAFEDALKQYKYIARQYAYFYKKFKSGILSDYFTFEEYRWAVSTVMTRQNQIPSRSNVDVQISALIPLWDFANHENGEISTDYDPEGMKTMCMAHRDFVENDQFTIFYGKRTNHDMLVHNGFVFDGNRHDCLTLRLGISKNDPLATEKYALLDRLSIPRNGIFYVAFEGDSIVDGVVVAFLRIITVTSREELAKWSEDDCEGSVVNLRDLLMQEQLEKVSDGKAYSYLKTRCNLLLQSYPTTLESDRELLASKPESQKVVDCLILRSFEKEKLLDVIKFCDKKLAEN